MGSFNTTCFASNQTIAEHDKARILPIYRQRTFNKIQMQYDGAQFALFGPASSTCYPDCFWAAQGPFFSGTYDDYGRFVLTPDARQWQQLRSFFKDVLQNCPEVKEGENSSHDIPFNFSAFLQEKAPLVHELCVGREDMPQELCEELEEQFLASWSYLWSVAQEQRLFYMDHSDEPTPLQFAVMHEDTYQLLLARATSGTNYRGESRAPQAYVRRTLESAKSAAQKFKDTPERALFLYDHHLSACASRLTNMNRHGFDATLSGERWRDLEQLLAGALSEDDFVEKVAQQLSDTYVMAALDALNLKLSPMVYAGQDYHNETGQAYAEFIAQVSASVTRSRMEGLYGPFKRYKLQAPNAEAVAHMEQSINEWDAAMVDVVSQPDGERLTVTFSCTLDQEDIVEFIQEVGDETGTMAATLAPVDAADGA